MTFGALVRHSLSYYWRTNVAVVAGVATAVAVLAGALMVGDSVRASLRELLLGRLGRTDHVVAATHFFPENLADRLASGGGMQAAPLIAMEATAAHEPSGRRASRVQVYGVDERFWKFHGAAVAAPDARELLISPGLAREFDAKPGDSLLLTVERPSDIPRESLHGRKEAGQNTRYTIREVAARPLGEFSLRPQQGAVRAVFVPLARLQAGLELQDRVNTVLVAGARPDEVLRRQFSVADAGLRVRVLEPQRAVVVESAGGVLTDAVAGAAQIAVEAAGARSVPVFTYLANTIRAGVREVPYSLVTATDLSLLGVTAGAEDIVLNDWAARELGARPGDKVTLEYYVWHPGGRLTTESADFKLAGVVPLRGAAADRYFAPQFPGITDSPTLSDWDPPFPLDLKRVRPQDERYWEEHRTTPKAFIPLERGQQLWQSRFGKMTSVRAYAHAGGDLDALRQRVEEQLRANLSPAQAGLTVFAARAEGLRAAKGATDFGEYFVYFSFFLVVSAVLLAALFFKLGITQRLREIGTLRALGFAPGIIRRLFIAEGAALAAAGALLGLAGAVGYAALIMYGLRTWWVDAVGTELLRLHVTPRAMLLGLMGGVLAALVSVLWSLRALRGLSPRALLAGSDDSLDRPRAAKARIVAVAAGGMAIAAAAMLVAGRLGAIHQVGAFFGAGTLALGVFLSLIWVWLVRAPHSAIGAHSAGFSAVSRLGFRNAGYRPAQAVLCIALIASATFILVAVSAFRHDPAGVGIDRHGGTGGYTLVAESTVAIAWDPNSAEGRENMNLAGLEGVRWQPFRLRPGDDASCLNLYQPASPRVMGATGAFLREGRFAFADSLAQTDAEKQNPWLLLAAGPDRAVPAIADANSLAYVLHKKLGDEIEIDGVRLRFVAALKDSVFQREIIVSETAFVRAFPAQQGYRVFLLETPPQKETEITGTIEDRLADYGFDANSTHEVLAGFHRVENTYLSTFQTLGALGLLLGTVGLGAVLLRNVLARRRELALLRAVGYRPLHLAVIILAENAMLLVLGAGGGTAAALLAIAPAFAQRGGRLGFTTAALVLAVLATGMLSSLVAARAALRSPLLAALRSE